MSNNKIPLHLQRDFILAGNAKVIFHNPKTGVSLTYKIKQAKDNNALYFVSCWSNDMYKYVGIISQNMFKVTGKVEIAGNRVEVQGFKYVFDKINANQDTGVDILHCGKCAKCARDLNDPASIETGFGPVCMPRSNKAFKNRVIKKFQESNEIDRPIKILPFGSDQSDATYWIVRGYQVHVGDVNGVITSKQGTTKLEVELFYGREIFHYQKSLQNRKSA